MEYMDGPRMASLESGEADPGCPIRRGVCNEFGAHIRQVAGSIGMGTRRVFVGSIHLCVKSLEVLTSLLTM